MNLIQKECASWRDPQGSIYYLNNKIYRTIMPFAKTDFEAVRATGCIQYLIKTGMLLPEQQVDKKILGDIGEAAVTVLEHPRLPFISYPYEWPYSVLKSAALLQLDCHLKALRDNVTLQDATAFNIQFQGCKPIFIDHLSFKPYVEGEIWEGHKQFCEQFLNPLLLQAYLKVPYQTYYRGNLFGIPTEIIKQLLPKWRWFSWRVLTHVILQSTFQYQQPTTVAKTLNQFKLPKSALINILTGLRKWITSLEWNPARISPWRNYVNNNCYQEKEYQIKKEFVAEFVADVKPKMLWDLGCNTGEFALHALKHGAHYAVGFDNDLDALEMAWQQTQLQNQAFLPLFMDLMNPTPNQGWQQQERKGLFERRNADALLMLALSHHMVIGNNLSWPQFFDWLLPLAPDRKSVV